MADILQLEISIKEIIDELKGICQTAGLTGSAAEEVVITSTFLYKFLNDKFVWNLDKFSDKIKMDKKDILNNKNDSLDAFYDTYGQDVAFTKEDTITFLAEHVGDDKFYKWFDDVLEHISNNPKNEAFSVETADGGKKPLFTRITENVEASKRNNFAKSLFASISKSKFDFGEAFDDNFDFYSTIFEYLIKDYNVASGTYAEYFTPQAVSKVIAKILVKMSPVKDTLYEIADFSAGSGSLVLHLANELGNGSFGNKARVYTQDISQKSTRFLRLNMMLNGLTESLDNIVEGDSLLTPAHFEIKGDANSGLKHFDFITMNPPFKMDFSSTRNLIEERWKATDRFFAGIPQIKKNDNTKMEIYLCFIQHILYSLKENGKAAIVVPTGFITAQYRGKTKKNGTLGKLSIEGAIREKITDKKWLKGVISMPPNIFANTGTNVSIIFIDKSPRDINEDDVILIDASKLGKTIKAGNNQKTVLEDSEYELIENTFINKNIVEGFSSKVSYDQIKEKNYYWAAGQYFNAKIEYVELTPEEFDAKMNSYKESLNALFDENKSLEEEIKKQLEELKYE